MRSNRPGSRNVVKAVVADLHGLQNIVCVREAAHLKRVDDENVAVFSSTDGHPGILGIAWHKNVRPTA
jgi:hypothetical protein